MCLGVPAKITETYTRDGLQMGKVDFGGVAREVCLDYVPEAAVGDYCIIHVGFAISLVSEDEARETLNLLQEIARFEEQTTPDSALPISELST
jgi:hydrogenase expression/formation protein HypC